MEADVTVLVVEPEEPIRERIGRLTEEAGFVVVTCPGPHAPHYECIGMLKDGCPLAEGADVVVLDMELDSDLAIQGTSAVELVGFYLRKGRSVVALCRDHREVVHPYVEEPVSLLRWPADEDRLVPVLREILGGTTAAPDQSSSR